MSNSKIEAKLEQVENVKNLDRNSNVFYKGYLLDSRKEYSTFSSISKNNGLANYMDCAKEYREKSKNYQELLIMAKYYELFEVSKGGTLEKQQKQLLSENLSMLYESMEKSGMIDFSIRTYNSMCSEKKMDILKVKKEQIADEFNFEKNYREKTEVLYLKNAFWLNKYKRMLSSFHLQEGFKKVENKYLKNDNLYYLLYMYSAKEEILKQVFKEAILHEDSDEAASSICENYEERYNKLFGNVFHKFTNGMHNDYMENYEYEVIKGSVSNKRHIVLETLLKHKIMENATSKLSSPIKEWGISERKDTYILFLENEGYMFPAQFHIPKYVYSDVLASLNIKKHKFPEYNSDEEKAMLEYQLMFKPTQEQLKEIKMQSKKDETFKRILEQINGRSHSSTKPNTLEVEIGEK